MKTISKITLLTIIGLSLSACDLKSLEPYEGAFKKVQPNCDTKYGNSVQIQVYTKDNSIRINDEIIRLGIDEKNTYYSGSSDYTAKGYKIEGNKLIQVDISRGHVYREQYNDDSSSEIITALDENTILIEGCRFERVN